MIWILGRIRFFDKQVINTVLFRADQKLTRTDKQILESMLPDPVMNSDSVATSMVNPSIAIVER